MTEKMDATALTQPKRIDDGTASRSQHLARLAELEQHLEDVARRGDTHTRKLIYLRRAARFIEASRDGMRQRREWAASLRWLIADRS